MQNAQLYRCLKYLVGATNYNIRVTPYSVIKNTASVQTVDYGKASVQQFIFFESLQIYVPAGSYIELWIGGYCVGNFQPGSYVLQNVACDEMKTYTAGLSTIVGFGWMCSV